MWRLAVAALLASAVPAGAQAASRGESPGFRWVVVEQGQTSGTPWSLSAIDSGDGRYCVRVSVKGSPRTTKCGRFFETGPSGSPVLLGTAEGNEGPQPTFVVGAVTQAARWVTIRLSDSTSRTIAVLPPRVDALAPGISFFIEAKPCAAYPIAVTALNAAHRVIARWSRAPAVRPLTRC